MGQLRWQSAKHPVSHRGAFWSLPNERAQTFLAVTEYRSRGAGDCAQWAKGEPPLNSALISKIEKARRYADEPDRVKFQRFEVTFHGENDEHTVSLDGESFNCSCHFFEAQGMGTCCHVMALQRMLAPMLSTEQQMAGAPFSFATAGV